MTTTDTPPRCAVCGQIIADRSTFIPTTLGAMHPSCWESGHKALAPQPTERDEFNVKMILRACEISLEDLEMLEGDILDLVVKARAEERAAQATQIAALLKAVKEAICSLSEYGEGYSEGIVEHTRAVLRAALEMGGG